MKISLIAAMTYNLAIGKDNKLLWHLPRDFEWFKEHTIDKPVIMGRKTFESIGHPLPGRKNIVITSNPDFNHSGVIVVRSVKAAIKIAYYSDVKEVMIIGGGEIYYQFMKYASRLYLTLVDTDIIGDTVFPQWTDNWKVSEDTFFEKDDKNSHDMRFLILDKKYDKKKTTTDASSSMQKLQIRTRICSIATHDTLS